MGFLLSFVNTIVWMYHVDSNETNWIKKLDGDYKISLRAVLNKSGLKNPIKAAAVRPLTRKVSEMGSRIKKTYWILLEKYRRTHQRRSLMDFNTQTHTHTYMYIFIYTHTKQTLYIHYTHTHTHTQTKGGACGVMVIVAGNGHGDKSSNPGQDWLHFI